ncbi:hypothetical protein HUJ04_005788 [Dendroctonus ponderosae]|nr:hypothetical protein HUJ04_005788 [Dendroctonus ponderosae]
MGCGCSRKVSPVPKDLQGPLNHPDRLQRSNSIQLLTGDDLSASTDKTALRRCTCRKTVARSALVLLLSLLGAFMVVWVVIPVSFMLSLPFQTFMVFVPIDSPRNADFDRPESFGLEGVRNFHISTRDYYQNDTWTSIGAWMLLPEDEISSSASSNVTEILQNTQKDILVYLHGVLANRAKALEQYRVLRRHFLVVAIDHRGYGDSGRNVRMGEEGMAHDHVQIFQWIKSINPQRDVYYWGHSMGSGISARTLKLLNQQHSISPTGLILESPFTSLEDVVSTMVLGRMFSWLAYFEAAILRPLATNGFHFRSKENIQSIDCPVMILHAEDDMIVSFSLGEALAQVAQDTREPHQGPVLFQGISADYGFGHNDIVHHPEIDDFIQNFQAICQNFTH